jgi:type IV pilus assembly protein PilB
VECEKCHFTGYKGRKAVYEVIPIDSVLGDHIKNGIFNVSEIFKQRGIKSLAENAFEIFDNGETSIEEIFPLLFNQN